jgi:N-acetylglucosamine kinase-like BadF-type ATPase
MIIIADSGSTKTDWKILISNEKELNIKTIGLNPYFLEKEQIHSILKSEIRNLINFNFKTDNLKIYFYGAGCGAETSKLKIKNCLHEVFQNAVIQVEDDMLGASRAAVGEGEGIVGILGTGSNVCLYQQGKITQRTPSNGIWFGDFGSAGNLGKCLITSYLNQDLPIELVSKFEEKYTDRRPEILDRVYSKPLPNQYLANFSHFIYENITHPYIESLVNEQFGLFFDFTLKKIPLASTFPYFLVGSVAVYYEKVIRKIASSKSIDIQNIINNPIDGLREYHKKINT